MKNQFLTTLLVLVVALFTTSITSASHIIGGELTWRCLGSGEYVFQVKFYRDCNGISGPGSVFISTTVPGVPSIPATLISQTDISTQGFYPDGITNCPTCGTGGVPAVFGIIEEFIYESAPVILNGVPPPTGWDFMWGQCCRSYAISNIAAAGSIGSAFRAKMFPYNGQNANSCFDSSPFFVERPIAVLCSGLPIVYQQLTVDSEFDSLLYEFDYAIDDLGNSIPYVGNSSVQNPLPMPATLNNSTGEISFVSSIAGSFVVALKVTAFKCAIPVSEIRREIMISINGNCPPLSGLAVNNAPNLIAPFVDNITGLQTSYADTVYAGDTVNFPLAAYDVEVFNNGNPQQTSIDAFGLQYGNNFTDVNSGCMIPPCATLFPPPPVVSPLLAATQFNWKTTSAHLGFSFSCVQFLNTYYFISKASDNFCPVNGNYSRVFSITVLPTIPAPPVVNNSGTLECNLGANYIYQWFFNRFAIPGASSFSFSPSQPGMYQVLAVAPDGQGNYSNGYVVTTVGINDNNLFSSVSVHPNPSLDGVFRLTASLNLATSLTITVTDIYGRIVLTDNKNCLVGNNEFRLNLNSHTSGIYNVEIMNDSGIFKSVKIVKL